MQNSDHEFAFKGKLMKYSANKGSKISGSINKSRQSQIINDDISMVGVGIEPKRKSFNTGALPS
jgi:hypothetical protein